MSVLIRIIAECIPALLCVNYCHCFVDLVACFVLMGRDGDDEVTAGNCFFGVVV